MAILGICLLGLVRPGWSHAGEPHATIDVAVDWPTRFEGRPLEAAPLHRFEVALARDFPGAIAAFSDGERRIVMRSMTRATRKVHPIADCLRAAGFTVRPVAARRDVDGNVWAALEAERDDETLFVRERLTGADGSSWTDVSAWFWSAWLHPDAGPWQAIIVFAPREDS